MCVRYNTPPSHHILYHIMSIPSINGQIIQASIYSLAIYMVPTVIIDLKLWLEWLFWTWLLIWLNKDSFQTWLQILFGQNHITSLNCKVTGIFDPPLVQILHLGINKCKCICQNFIHKYFCQFSYKYILSYFETTYL